MSKEPSFPESQPPKKKGLEVWTFICFFVVCCFVSKYFGKRFNGKLKTDFYFTFAFLRRHLTFNLEISKNIAMTMRL